MEYFPNETEWEKVVGAGPVEDAVQKVHEKNGTGPSAVQMEAGATPPQTGAEYFGSEVPAGKAVNLNVERAQAGLPPFKPASTPEEELIKAQHLFIEGLLNFLHDPTQVAQFAGEQEQYIRASMRYTGTKLGQK